MAQNHLVNLIKMAATFQEAVNEHYRGAGLQYVDVPQIVGITGACENIDTLFKVRSRVPVPLFFTQTGQLALEQALQYYPGVFTSIHSGRDELFEDERHLRQFKLTEEEFDWSMVSTRANAYDEEIMYEALLQHIESAVKYITKRIATSHVSLLQDVYKRDVAGLLASMEHPFLRISYQDAIELLKKNGYADLAWGFDLEAEHEAKIVELLNIEERKMNSVLPKEDRAVIIMKYPQEIKFFNMKQSEKDPRVVMSADLILPNAGESVGSAVREHNGDKLRERLLGSTMFRLHKERGGTYDDFVWYTEELVAAGKTNPHAGYGLGNERLLQFIMGSKDIRDCSVFSLLARQTGDWEIKEHKTAAFEKMKMA